MSKAKIKNGSVMICAICAVMSLLVIGLDAKATVVEISTATNKATYELGEPVSIYVTAYNPNPTLVILDFYTEYFASYAMDGVFDWRGPQPPPFHGFWQVTIPAQCSYTWNFFHPSWAYSLSLGTHIVVGEVIGYGQSQPVQFQVVPEPATIFLLAFGSLALLKTKRRP